MSEPWFVTGKRTPEEERRYENIVLASGAKALSMAFGGTPEDWRQEQQRILNKRQSLPEVPHDTKWSVQ